LLKEEDNKSLAIAFRVSVHVYAIASILFKRLLQYTCEETVDKLSQLNSMGAPKPIFNH